MKRILLIVSFALNCVLTAQVGIGTNSPHTSAALEVQSSNKGVLFPKVTLTSTSDVTTIATPASGLTVFNTASAGTSPNNVTPGYYYWNGSKWIKMAIETPFAKTVYVNATSPSTATIFDENNPATTDDNALEADDANLYIGSNGSTWTYNTSTSNYVTFQAPSSTPFNLASTTTDAGSNKTSAIERVGSVSVTNGFLRASGNSNSFTMDPTQGGGPRLMLGTTVAPNSYFELGAYNSMNNFDTKGRDFNIFSTARANALYLKHNTGSIGIGTNDPLSTLHVLNPLAATNTINADATLLRLSRPTASGKWGNVAQFNLGSYTIGGAALSRLDIGLNNGGDLTTLTTAMTLQADGNVGIGTTAPTQRLDVNGTGLFRRGNSTGSTFNQILFGFNSGSNYQHAIKTRHAGGTAQGNAIDFYVWTNAVTDATVANQHLMSLEGQGRVGIGGITNPTSVIDASSTSVATATVNASRKMLRLSIPTAEGTKTGNVAEFNMGSYAAGGSASTRLDLALNNGSDNTVSQVMTWQANGNVGIGTAAPASRLDVSAGATSTNSIVNATGSINDYLQFNIQNTSTGTQAQSGYSATANNGSPTTGFAWLGINNSNFNFPTSYNIGGANDVSFIGSGQDLYVANANNTKSIIFSTGKATAPFFNEQMRILNNGNVGIGTSDPVSKLEVNGSITNKTAFNAVASSSIVFSNSNLAYTSANPGAFTLINIKDGGCYTLAVRGTTAGTSSFVSTGFTFKSVSNGITDSGFETLYKFTVIGTVVYVEMIKGL